MAYPMSTKISKNSTPSGVGSSVEGGNKSAASGGWGKGLVTLIIVLIIIGGGVYLISSYTGIGSGLLPSLGGVDFKTDWQAVFLTNGQVYFGKIAKMDQDFIFLTDVYYLQVVNLKDAIGQAEDVQTQPEQRLTLIKLGNEIHGPIDEMKINRDHVLIIEDLKDDSRVVQAINDNLTKSDSEEPASIE